MFRSNDVHPMQSLMCKCGRSCVDVLCDVTKLQNFEGKFWRFLLYINVFYVNTSRPKKSFNAFKNLFAVFSSRKLRRSLSSAVFVSVLFVLNVSLFFSILPLIFCFFVRVHVVHRSFCKPRTLGRALCPQHTALIVNIPLVPRQTHRNLIALAEDPLLKDCG